MSPASALASQPFRDLEIGLPQSQKLGLDERVFGQVGKLHALRGALFVPFDRVWHGIPIKNVVLLGRLCERIR